MKNNVKPLALMIDDDLVSCVAMEFALKKFGLEPMITSEPKEFLNLARKHSPSLFLIDLNLGQSSLNGFDLIESIYKEYGNLIPIIVISGSKNFKDVVYALEIGANDFISKPLDKEILASKLSRYISNPEILAHPLAYTKIPNGPIASDLTFFCEVELIDEAGVKLICSHLISQGTRIELAGALIQKLTGKEAPLQLIIGSSWIDSDRSSYGAYAKFNFKDQDLLRTVRRWLIINGATCKLDKLNL